MEKNHLKNIHWHAIPVISLYVGSYAVALHFLKNSSTLCFCIRSPIFVLGSDFTSALIILPSTGMISIPTRSCKTHLQEFPRHIHTNEVFPPSKLTEHGVYLSRRFASSSFIYRSPMSTNVVCIRANQ